MRLEVISRGGSVSATAERIGDSSHGFQRIGENSHGSERIGDNLHGSERIGDNSHVFNDFDLPESHGQKLAVGRDCLMYAMFARQRASRRRIHSLHYARHIQ
jgi:hypothetical protein